jgi:exodeoxyribonuclease-3
VKIATYNVNGVNGRLPRILDWLRETSPDVACLQEIKTSDEKCPAAAIEAAGYASLWHGQRSHHGVAILSKGARARELRRGLPGDDEDKQARYLEAEIDGLRIASIYLPNGNPTGSPNFEYKLAWFERLVGYAGDLIGDGRPTILAGDLNVVPTNADIYNAWAWRFDAVMQPETRKLYQRLLAQGWLDSTRHLHPKERIYTFWVNHAYFQRNAGFRMDFLLISPGLLPRLQSAEVDAEFRGREGASDHAPAWISLAPG